MKIVEFCDGTFGIRRGNWLTGYEYLDLQNLHAWWKPSISYFLYDCRVNSLQSVTDKLDLYQRAINRKAQEKAKARAKAHDRGRVISKDQYNNHN